MLMLAHQILSVPLSQRRPSHATTLQLRAAGGLAPWSEPEVRHAAAEVADRRIQLTVAEAGALRSQD